jgi:hypothetical protein
MSALLFTFGRGPAKRARVGTGAAAASVSAETDEDGDGDEPAVAASPLSLTSASAPPSPAPPAPSFRPLAEPQLQAPAQKGKRPAAQPAKNAAAKRVKASPTAGATADSSAGGRKKSPHANIDWDRVKQSKAALALLVYFFYEQAKHDKNAVSSPALSRSLPLSPAVSRPPVARSFC